MNNSSVDTEDLMQHINTEKVHLLIPVIAYICILMVTGLVGNLMVCYYYCFKTKMVHMSVFILTLAVYDMIVCIISMPFEIMLVVWFYTFENVIACKFIHLINYFAAIASPATLIAIAIDRYRHICAAVLNKMTVKAARKYCVLVAGIAMLLSWPALLLFDTDSVPVPNKFGLDLEGHICTQKKEESFKHYESAFNITLFALFTISLIVLVVLYSSVCRFLYIHRKNFGTCQQNTISVASNKEQPDVSSDAETKLSILNEKKSSENKQNTSELDSHKKEQKSDITIASTEQKSNTSTEEARQIKKPAPDLKPDRQAKHTDRETARIAVMMNVITALYFLSFIPYLCLATWRSFKKEHQGQFLSDAGLVGFEIGIRSYLLNSSLNPWIYGIFNRRFRQYYYRLLCCKST